MTQHKYSGVKLGLIQRECCDPDCDAAPMDGSPVPLCPRHFAAVARAFIAIAKDRHDQAVLDVIDSVNPEKTLSRAFKVIGDDRRSRAVVYFVRFGSRIKIGTTTDLSRRLTEIPHDEVLCVVPGGADVERRHHEDFARWRLTGEWFAATDECLAAVAAIG